MKFVPLVAEYDVHMVRRIAINIHLPSVLSNIVLEYFSQVSSCSDIVESIYDKDIVWRLRWENKTNYRLEKTITTNNDFTSTGLFQTVHSQQDDQSSKIGLIFSQTTFECNRRTEISDTTLIFNSARPRWYSLDTRSSREYSFTPVPFKRYMTFLDDAIVEFGHPILLNTRSVVDSLQT